MFVIKRNGSLQKVSFDKILNRITAFCYGLDEVEPSYITQKVIGDMADDMKTSDIDTLTCEVCTNFSTMHPDYNVLAARIAVSNLHKETDDVFSDAIEKLYAANLIHDDVYRIITENKQLINSRVICSRDFNYSFFGLKTLFNAYLQTIDDKIVERPQFMLMRVSIGIHADDFYNVFKTYDMMSNMIFTHATPTLFNAGTPRPQCSSCFLLTMNEDSIEGIYDTLKECAVISKGAGGIGLNVNDIRAKGSYIAGTNGKSNGLVPMLRVFNTTAKYVDQGGGKRKGAFSVYISPWHGDILEFLKLKLNTGAEEQRATDLFYGLWISDLFMERVENHGMWSLMCPNKCRDLNECYGDEFKQKYIAHEENGNFIRRVKAREVWKAIIISQMETGTPYMLYKDSINEKSNQKNIGMIKSSNLCVEIQQHASKDEIAVCNLASISLKKCIVDGKFDHKVLFDIVQQIVINLNRVIDINYYPGEDNGNNKTRKSNLRHRPMGIGVQGLANTFIELDIPFVSQEALLLNAAIFETIYYAACFQSNKLAERDGAYETYEGSPASKGILQFDMWDDVNFSGLWDWDALKVDISKHGLRNSLLVAPMPTASSSQILDNYESFDPINSNIYMRQTKAGSFYVINKYLIDDLSKLNLWSPQMKDKIIEQQGSIQSIDEIPISIRKLHITSFDIQHRFLIDMAVARSPFIDQSQSFSMYKKEPTYQIMTSAHFYGWKKKLKTGMYYLRTRVKNGIEEKEDKKDKTETPKGRVAMLCSKDDDDCLTCSS